MCPTGRERDLATGGQLLEPGIAIDMQDAAIAGKMGLRPFGLAIGFVKADRRWRFAARPAPLIAYVDPEVPGFRTATPRVEHRDRRVIGEQMIGVEDMASEAVVQGIEPPAGPADPSSQGRTLQIHAVAHKDPRLAVKWKMIGIFADKHMSEQRRGGQPFGDDPFGRVH